MLVLEDDYFLAKETAEAVRDAGGTVLGPVPNVDAAMSIIADTAVDAAILDIHLSGGVSFPVAVALHAKGVRMVFVSGYDDWFLPKELKAIPICPKPVNLDEVIQSLVRTG